MAQSLNTPPAIQALNQFFSDLIALADFEAQLPQLRRDVEALRLEALDLGGLAYTRVQVRSYLEGLVQAGTLTPTEELELRQRLNTVVQRGGDNPQFCAKC